MPYPDRFYPVVDSVAWVARLAALGVGTVQLRAKDLDDGAALQLVTDALAVTKDTPTKLVVNDYWRAAVVAGAKHLHLGQEDLAEADLAAIRDAGLTLGISTHDDEELATALRRRAFLKSPNGKSASERFRWLQSAASSSNRRLRSSPPAPTLSLWSATS